MIWRSTLVLFTGFAAFYLAGENWQAKAQDAPVLISQSATVNPDSAVNTNQAVPNFGGQPQSSPLQSANSAEQIQKVKALQQELKNRGYYKGPIDGIYGPATDAAIRNLRGAQGQPANNAAPSPTAIPQPPAAVGTAQTESAQASGGTATETNAPQTPNAEANESINIGDQVSPATGTTPPAVDGAEADGAEADGAEADGTENDVTNTAAPSPSGPGSMLWAGLALMAALGSFGVGFILVNRTSGNNEEEEVDSSWGAVPEEVPQNGDVGQRFMPMNGNGTNGASHADVVIDPIPTNQQPSHPSPSDLPTVVPTANAMVGQTTRLAKVDVMDELVANLQVSDPAKRRKAIWELGQRGNSSAVQHLVNGMVDADSKEKSLILAALSEIGIRSLKPMSRALAIALQDENPDVRKNAIRDLTRVYDLVTQISQMLGHATEDEDPEVRRTAEWALGQLNRIREAPKLQQAATNSLEASPSGLMSEDMENLKN